MSALVASRVGRVARRGMTAAALALIAVAMCVLLTGLAGVVVVSAEQLLPPTNRVNLRGVPRNSEPLRDWTDSDQQTVFFGVAAFRDVECVMTVREIFRHAVNPRRVFLGIIEQNEHGDPTCVPDEMWNCVSPDFCPIDNIRRRLVVSKNARGPTFGRYVAMLMYRGEMYFCSIDSHNVFALGHERKSIAQLWRARSSRSVLSHYPNIWDKSGPGHESNGNVMVMCNGHFLPLGFIRMDAAWMDRQLEPFNQPFSAAGYLFADARMVHDVLFDPYLDFLFDGEEILYSVRMWTHGWDIFTPGESVLYHDYARHSAKRYWHVPGSQWGYIIAHSQKRAQYFLGVRRPNVTEYLIPRDTTDLKIIREEAKFGVGSRRSLQQYEAFAKIDMVNRIANFAFCQQHVKSKTEL